MELPFHKEFLINRAPHLKVNIVRGIMFQYIITAGFSSPEKNGRCSCMAASHGSGALRVALVAL